MNQTTTTYKDGYIDLAPTYFQAEELTEARTELGKALTLKPNDARALYHLAQVERRDKMPGAEIADLESCLATQSIQIRKRQATGRTAKPFLILFVAICIV